MFCCKSLFNKNELKFEGFTDGLRPQQLKFVENVLRKLGYSEGTVIIAPVGKEGDNYAADVRRFTIDKDGKSFKIVAKIASGDPNVNSAFGQNILFNNEHVMYTSILPKFSKLEEAAGVPECDRFRYAKCYGSLAEDLNQIILLEDLLVGGFKMLDKLRPLTEEAVRLILKDFASYNSLAYAWKTLEPITFEEETSRFIDMFKSQVIEQMKMIMKKVEENALDVLQDEKYKKYVRNFEQNFRKMVDEILKMNADHTYHVIQQGDSWTNNMMFRLEDGKPIQSCLIDYQNSRVTSPVVDLCYFIFNCTDHEMRMKHFYDWIDYYYSCLKKYLSYHGIAVETVYPRYQLNKELKHWGKVCMPMEIMVATLTVKEGSDAENMKAAMFETDKDKLQELIDSGKLKTVNPEAIAISRRKLEGVIDSHIELGLEPAVC